MFRVFCTVIRSLRIYKLVTMYLKQISVAILAACTLASGTRASDPNIIPRTTTAQSLTINVEYCNPNDISAANRDDVLSAISKLKAKAGRNDCFVSPNNPSGRSIVLRSGDAIIEILRPMSQKTLTTTAMLACPDVAEAVNSVVGKCGGYYGSTTPVGGKSVRSHEIGY
jgi:hypothetical protein